MKEQIQKLAQDLTAAVELLKEEKIPEATEALGQVADSVAALDAEATKADETLAAKDAELATANEQVVEKDAQIAKYANLNISTEDLPSLFEELNSVKTMLTGVTEVMKAASTKEDIATLGTRLETLEKAANSRQIQDEQRQSMQKSAIAGLDLTPRP